MMFRLLARRPVHEAETPNEILIAVATQPAPSVGSFVAGLSVCVVEVVDKVLCLDRSERWSDVRGMQEVVQHARVQLQTDQLERVWTPQARIQG